MSTSRDYFEYITGDILQNIPGITSKRMFGGYGIYKDGFIFAILSGDEIFFKVDETNETDYKKIASHPFTYTKQGKEMTISYWAVPESILEDSDILFGWIEKSVAVSRRAKK